jgi:hypothetical protein
MHLHRATIATQASLVPPAPPDLRLCPVDLDALLNNSGLLRGLLVRQVVPVGGCYSARHRSRSALQEEASVLTLWARLVLKGRRFQSLWVAS